MEEMLMHSQTTLGLLSHIGFALLGLDFAWRGLRKSAQHRSLLMRWRGEPAVPMGMGWRIVQVSLGLFLAVISIFLALGWVH
jgi:hypothetical protein